MPRVSNETASSYWEPMSVGPIAQVDLSAAVGAPASVVNGTPFVVGPIFADGFKVISAGAILAQSGTLAIQRYVDTAGTIPQGTAASTPLTANAPGVVNLTDGLPFQSFTLTLTNTGSGSAALAGFALLLNAA